MICVPFTLWRQWYPHNISNASGHLLEAQVGTCCYSKWFWSLRLLWWDRSTIVPQDMFKNMLIPIEPINFKPPPVLCTKKLLIVVKMLPQFDGSLWNMFLSKIQVQYHFSVPKMANNGKHMQALGVNVWILLTHKLSKKPVCYPWKDQPMIFLHCSLQKKKHSRDIWQPHNSELDWHPGKKHQTSREKKNRILSIESWLDSKRDPYNGLL